MYRQDQKGVNYSITISIEMNLRIACEGANILIHRKKVIHHFSMIIVWKICSKCVETIKIGCKFSYETIN